MVSHSLGIPTCVHPHRCFLSIYYVPLTRWHVEMQMNEPQTLA